jgi:cytochrome oxidase Cu insertion factor (SCO1/SenC/PrrC family)
VVHDIGVLYLNIRLFIIGLVAALAGLIGGIAFIPGAVDSVFPKPGTTSVGRALVGGPFELTAHDGRRVSDQTFRGKLMLVYFGFTYCPDICPAGLQVVTAALEELGEDAGKVAPLFITVDPERDTVDQMKQYVLSFHKNFVGLTGSPEDIAKAAKAYRVYYRKVQDEALTEYTMDHTSFLYLMGPDGAFITHFPHTISPEKLAQRLAAEIARLPAGA